jgi:hypothetical protein
MTKLCKVQCTSALQHEKHNLETGLPGNIRALLTPSRIVMAPKARVRYLRSKLGPDLFNGDGRLKTLVTRHCEQERRKLRVNADGSSSTSSRGTYGGLQQWVEKKDKDYLVANKQFDEHTVYLLADPVIDATTHRVVIAVSTENLLLNAYRQQVIGLPSYLMVDTAHRLVVEGHNCMLIGTMDASQHFHIIAYGICSHEDTYAHDLVLDAVRRSVEAVVHERARKRLCI